MMMMMMMMMTMITMKGTGVILFLFRRQAMIVWYSPERQCVWGNTTTPLTATRLLPLWWTPLPPSVHAVTTIPARLASPPYRPKAKKRHGMESLKFAPPSLHGSFWGYADVLQQRCSSLSFCFAGLLCPSPAKQVVLKELLANFLTEKNNGLPKDKC